MKYIIDIPNEMVIKSVLNGLTLGIAMTETSTQKQFIIPTNIPLIPYIEPQKWIPCSERTPNYPNGAEIYWCSACKCDVHAEQYIVMIKGAVLPTALFWDGYHWFDTDLNETLYPVVAWMPFPEPWKGEEE